MLRDITLGQYYPGESVIHRLDPRTKIIATLVYIVSLFVVDSFVGMAIATLAILLLVKISKVPFKFITRGLKPIMFIIAFTFVINMFMFKGEPLFAIGPLVVSKEGLKRAVFMAVRLVLLIFGSSLLTLTTKPINLTDGLESLFKPLSVIGLPAHELAMMMSIALRFIPTLLEETDKIMKAQQARGADFESGNLLQRAKALIPILVPLFISAFRIAQELAQAMEARCYRGGSGRTRMNAMKFRKGDLFAAFIMIAFLGTCIAERIIL
ncbi:MAG: energy-coupling factor transporter transmembrane protein EcfT [Clostridiales bacterium]|nr:energy-coupling factor transporter transmembrane protein EcfT [Clostridiales bacterium]